MASTEEYQEPAVESSDGRDDKGSAAENLAAPDSPDDPHKAPEEVEAVAERTSEDAEEEEPKAAAGAPSHSPGSCSEVVVDSEEEGTVHSPEPTPQPRLSKDVGRDVLEVPSAAPLTQKGLSSHSVKPLEGELDFEDDAPPESPSSTSLFDKETKEKGDKLEEGEAEDDGEVSDISGESGLSATEDDLEEGELPEVTGDSSGVGFGRKFSVRRQICRFFCKGQCTWGTSCRFLHPGINDQGNYSMFASGPKPQQQHHMPPPVGAGPAGVMWSGVPPPDFLGFLGPPMPLMVPDDIVLPPVESAWERGLRQAKELVKQASRRKKQEPDFEEKRLNLVPLHHDRTPMQAEVNKENDFYKASTVPLPFQGAGLFYGRPAVPPPSPPRLSRGGWRADGRREEFYGSGYSHGPRPYRPHWGGPDRDLRWREECFPGAPSPPMARSRPDEWRDPWRRSKTPKGRRSRSGGRKRRSFSNSSSRSFSSRSSRSSYSYSRSSSSRSSYFSYDRRSRSRSPAANATAGRPRGNRPRSPSYTPPSRALAKHAGRGNTRRSGGRSPVLRRRKPYNPSPLAVATTPPSPPRKARRRATRSSSSLTPSRSRSRSPSLTTVSSASSSPIRHRVPVPASAAKTPWLRARNPSQLTEGPKGSKKQVEKDSQSKGSSKTVPPPPPPAGGLAPAVVTPSYREPLQPTLDLSGFEEEQSQLQAQEARIHPRPQIKLTLLKKTLPLALLKKEEPTVKNSGDKEPLASAKSPSPLPSGRKRREELLKQLRAVEDAIARKRAKFS